MTDLQATLDAIDEVAVHECGHCRHPLDPDGPSWDFCSESCQVAWTRDRHEVHELVGYRAPLTAALDELRHLEESAVRQHSRTFYANTGTSTGNAGSVTPRDRTFYSTTRRGSNK